MPNVLFFMTFLCTCLLLFHNEAGIAFFISAFKRCTECFTFGTSVFSPAGSAFRNVHVFISVLAMSVVPQTNRWTKTDMMWPTNAITFTSYSFSTECPECEINYLEMNKISYPGSEMVYRGYIGYGVLFWLFGNSFNIEEHVITVCNVFIIW